MWISFREQSIVVSVDFSWLHSIPVAKQKDMRIEENVVMSPIDPLRKMRTLSTKRRWVGMQLLVILMSISLPSIFFLGYVPSQSFHDQQEKKW